MMWCIISIGVVTLATLSGVAAQPVLVPGALLADCRSALRVGVVACSERAADSAKPESASEAQVSEYLAEYGKPPREAVRALLYPSDKNIAAWIRKQRRVISIATYVAARMTEMQSQLDPESLDHPMPASNSPAMVQMRVTLFLDAASGSSRLAARVLQQVVSRYPSVDGRIVQVGFQSERQPLNWLIELDTLLPISIASPDTINNFAFPSVLIEDLRYGTRQRLNATNITPRQISDQMVALRGAGEIHGHPTGSSWLSP